jgi:REP element-mobilizing transposase RayT
VHAYCTDVQRTGGKNVIPNLAPEIDEALRGRWEPVYRSQLHYLVTWSTRGRRPVLRDRHVRALRDLVQRTCDELDFTLVEFAAAPEHVHLVLALSPTQSISSTVRQLKGRTGLTLLQTHPELRVWLRGNLIWDEPYSVETVSATRVERVCQRLRALHSPDEDLAVAS